MKIENTAYHEAGHASTAYFLKVPFKKVSIVPTADSLGHLIHKPPKWYDPSISFDFKTEKYIRDRIMVSLAGKETEKLYSGRYNNIGASGDMENATNLALEMIFDAYELGAYLKWLRLFTIRFVKLFHHWAVTEDIAKELIENQTLSMKQVDELALNTLKNLSKRSGKN